MYSNEASNLKIKLPYILDINNKPKPDYIYMEQYIKSLPYSDRI